MFWGGICDNTNILVDSVNLVQVSTYDNAVMGIMS